MKTNVEQVLSIHNQVGEGPIWSVAEQALYWVDLGAQQFYRLDPETGDVQTVDTHSQIGCIAFHEQGGLIVVMKDGIYHWQNSVFKLVLSSDALKTSNRFNDGAIDPRGRLWVGTASAKPENILYCIHADGNYQVAERDIYISNGIGWSPDHTTMYYSDSGSDGLVYRYDYNVTTGRLSNRRVFLPPTGDDSVADGLTVDSDGHIWIAYWNGWRVECRNPEGKLIHQIDMPVQRPTSCCFGGKDLNELYITSAGKELNHDEQPAAGDIFRVRVESIGVAEVPCKLSLDLDEDET